MAELIKENYHQKRKKVMSNFKEDYVWVKVQNLRLKII